MTSQGFLLWSPSRPSLPLSFFPFSNSTVKIKSITRSRRSLALSISAAPESDNGRGGGGVGGQGQLTARERRQLRNEKRRENMGGVNWREEVEERLMKKPKKKYASWMEELNLDNLSLLGPQWWVVRVSRVAAPSTAELIARALARNFPDLDFKVYIPAVRVKRKLKNGSYSEKSNPLFPGCIFLHCVLNKEIHDFVREVIGIGGFLGSKVGNTKRQINRPKPVSSDDMDAIYKQAKEEQEKADRAFEEQQQAERIFNGEELNIDSSPVAGQVTKSMTGAKPRRRSKKTSEPSDSNPLTGEDISSLVPGASVRMLSGPFAEFTGCLKELNHKTGKATVGFMLLGKESLVDVDINHIAADET